MFRCRNTQLENRGWLQTTLLLTGLVWIALILIWMLQGCASQTAKRARRAKGDNCLECHREATQAYQQQEFLHASIAKGDCRDCHLSHGVSNKLVLVKEEVTV